VRRLTFSSDDREAARDYLFQLRPLREFGDPEMIFQINLLEIDFHIRINEFDIAMELVTKRLSEVEAAGSGAYPDTQLTLTAMC
jgi:anaphase-promoting complex subunit 5